MNSFLFYTKTRWYSMNPFLSHATWSDDLDSSTHKWGESVSLGNKTFWFGLNHHDRLEWVPFPLPTGPRANWPKSPQSWQVILTLSFFLACFPRLVFFSFTFSWEFPNIWNFFLIVDLRACWNGALSIRRATLSFGCTMSHYVWSFR